MSIVKSVMKILITAPASTIGRRIVSDLLAPEFSVRVITRNPSRIPVDIRPQVEVMRGSTDDPKALRTALEGVDALFWYIPRAPIEDGNLQGCYERHARAASRAIREVRMPRVVSISTSDGFNSSFHVMEEALNESGAAIRHLRRECFTENLDEQASSTARHGPIPYAMPEHTIVPMSAVGDVADVALRLLVRTDWSGVEVLSVGRLDELHSERAKVFETLLT